MRISLILAKSTNNVIGDKGAIPWRLPDDMKFFRRITMGKPIIMGRRTFQSLKKPLPGRQNIVLTKNPTFSASGAIVVTDFDSALWAAADVEEVMVIGGAQIYEMAHPIADRIYLTQVDAVIDGDTALNFDLETGFEETCRQEHPADARHVYSFSIIVLDRIH